VVGEERKKGTSKGVEGQLVVLYDVLLNGGAHSAQRAQQLAQ
jgi:hypothetical protein